ncbi:MAG: geranylgeranylglyceryl phosphate synthase family protein [Paludibacteraceae bacterium]|nr:geranylgeranylglyceryl phosphate synthase family protein [Paludibacteraceae bacterium]
MSNRQLHKGLALLLDPEKANLEALPISADCHPDYIFVGGSTGGDPTGFIRALREKLLSANDSERSFSETVFLRNGLSAEGGHGHLPIILFPGDAAQFSPNADAILFLSLLSGDNPEYLVGQQIKAARAIRDSQIDFVPTAYILIDGGVETSTMRVSGTRPIPPSDVNCIVDTAIAAELMGKTAIYLEAGSGAIHPVSPDIIRAVRERTSCTLIVGGGIRTPEAMNAAYDAGADIVVIGNHFESHPEELALFTSTPRQPRPTSQPADDIRFMRLALAEAQKALSANEIPIGCVIVSEGQVIGRGHNLTETLSDVTAHAEMQAITAATQTLGGKYLPDATLYVTVEPCAMCAGAIGWAQIRRIVYGAPDPKRGYATYAPRAFHPKAAVTAGVLEDECRELIQSFFKLKR